MLIVADFLNWARNNGIPIGEGRGCLTGDAKVLTSKGFKDLKDIKIGDKVYSHMGEKRQVTNTMNYDVSNEELVRLRSAFSFGKLTLTKNHKIYGCKANYINKDYQYKYKHHCLAKDTSINYPAWIESDQLNIGDYIYHIFPNKNTKDFQITFDLAKFCKPEFVLENKIKIRGQNYFVNRFIVLNDDLLYLLGRWVGDGCLRHKMTNGISIVFNSKDLVGIQKIYDILVSIGFNPHLSNNKNNCSKIEVSCSVISSLFLDIFPNYINSSKTKHFPRFFRKLSFNQLNNLINGLEDSDGMISQFNQKEIIKTTSLRLVNEIKESLFLMGIASTIYTEKYPKRNGKITQTTYSIHFNGIKTSKNIIGYDNYGFFAKINKKEYVKEQYVYDITVNKDNSYYTSNGVVHNSAGGSLVGYLLDIHKADPIKYGLIFARFQNKLKKEYPV